MCIRTCTCTYYDICVLIIIVEARRENTCCSKYIPGTWYATILPAQSPFIVVIATRIERVVIEVHLYIYVHHMHPKKHFLYTNVNSQQSWIQMVTKKSQENKIITYK